MTAIPSNADVKKSSLEPFIHEPARSANVWALRRLPTLLGRASDQLSFTWLMRAVQGEGGDLDVEAFTVPGFHLIAAGHDA